MRVIIPRWTGRTDARPMSRDKADTLLLLTSCALVLAPHIAHLPFWVGPVCASLLLWRGWVTFRGNRMPSRWLLAPIAVLAMGGVYASYKTLLGREAGVAMLALLLTLKLLEMHARRDLFVALFLSFFLILSSFFYSQSIGTAVLTIVAVIAILTTQLSFQYTGAVPPLKQRLRLGAAILGLAAPLTLVLFLLFPRIQGPLWGLPSDAQQGRTGMSESMTPGNIASLAESDEIAFRARFIDPLPAKHLLYWRGIVLGNYDGRTWTPMSAHVLARQKMQLGLRGVPVRYEVTLEPNGYRWLFALDMPRAVPHIAGNPASASSELQLQTASPINERLRYEAASHVDYLLQPRQALETLRPWLALPAGWNPQTLAFAADLASNAASKNQIIDAVLRMFREQNFRYTLEPPLLGRNAVDDFLFNTRAGFCEHYASAFVVLMRAAGIPARVITGYQGGELNPEDGYLTVRQSDAHAWAEVWLEGSGWKRVDPTAAVSPQRIERNLSSAVPRRLLGGLITLDAGSQAWLAPLRRWRQGWEAISNAWNQWVLNYTPERQRNFVRSLGLEWMDWRTLAVLMLVAGMTVCMLALLPLIMRRPKRDPIEALYLKLCQQLARKGLPRAPHEGPRTYAARIAAAGSPLSPARKKAATSFLQLIESLRYGVNNASPRQAIPQLKSLLSQCR